MKRMTISLGEEASQLLSCTAVPGRHSRKLRANARKAPSRRRGTRSTARPVCLLWRTMKAKVDMEGKTVSHLQARERSRQPPARWGVSPHPVHFTNPLTAPACVWGTQEMPKSSAAIPAR